MSHWRQHRNACVHTGKLYDERLFRVHSEWEECPICMLLLPIDHDELKLKSCCGKVLCEGCNFAQFKDYVESGRESEYLDLCPFCRTPGADSEEESANRLNKLCEKNNAAAIYLVATYYFNGEEGYPRDTTKAMELFLKAGELGYAYAYQFLGQIYRLRWGGVNKDKAKAREYYELATTGGNISARCILGRLEEKNGDNVRAYKHYLIAAKAGKESALKKVRDGFKAGFATRDEYAGALRAYQKQQEEMKV